jgi:hypothetical protein
MTNLSQIDKDALERAVATVRKSRAEAKRIDERLAKSDWFGIATDCAFHAQMIALGLKPWMSPPMFAHITEPRRDEQAIALLHRLLAANLSRYEPDPLGALAEAEKPAK